MCSEICLEDQVIAGTNYNDEETDELGDVSQSENSNRLVDFLRHLKCSGYGQVKKDCLITDI